MLRSGFKTLLVLILSVKTYGQKRKLPADTRKGTVAVSWGWNRGFYTHSNITFNGSDYHFKLYHVDAHDKPRLPITWDYIKFKKLTVPQTDLRVSYFIKDNLAVSFGDDHMKYVMTQDQWVKMKGEITRAGNYKGVYNDDKKMTEDFLTFEHTDGLNYLNIELEKYYTWYRSRNGNCSFSAMVGGGGGVLFPKTNVKLLDYERNDRFHISGFGLSGKAGILAVFFRHLLVKLEDKYGYINMPDIILHKKGIQGRAKQGFFFTELYGTVGCSFKLTNSNKRK